MAPPAPEGVRGGSRGPRPPPSSPAPPPSPAWVGGRRRFWGRPQGPPPPPGRPPAPLAPGRPCAPAAGRARKRGRWRVERCRGGAGGRPRRRATARRRRATLPESRATLPESGPRRPFSRALGLRRPVHDAHDAHGLPRPSSAPCRARGGRRDAEPGGFPRCGRLGRKTKKQTHAVGVQVPRATQARPVTWAFTGRTTPAGRQRPPGRMPRAQAAPARPTPARGLAAAARSSRGPRYPKAWP